MDALVTMKCSPDEFRIVSKALEVYEQDLKDAIRDAHRDGMKQLRAELVKLQQLRERLHS